MMRAVVAILLLLFTLTACGSAPGATGPPPSSAVSTPAGPLPDAEEPEPAAIRIPRLAAESTLVPLGLNADRTIQVPAVDRPMQAGWYQHGPRPGGIGPAVVLGHVDGGGKPGIFHRLRELVAGDEIVVSRVDGSTVAFVVRETVQVAKKEFPTELVYGETDQVELRLITCGGSFDKTARSYPDNVIVYASLAG